MSGVQVAFHFNAADKWAYTCRLVRKALSRGARLVVCADGDGLKRIDVGLWTLHPQAFLPHAGVQSPLRVVSRSPVRLCSQLVPGESGDVLVNLLPETPTGFERFNRLIDVVGTDEASRVAARARWRAHVADGRQPDRHDLGAHDD